MLKPLKWQGRFGGERGSSSDGYGVFEKSIRLFAFTAESQRTQGKAIFFVGRYRQTKTFQLG